MTNEKIFKIAFSNIYVLYIDKIIRKNRTKAEVDEIICWLTGYDIASLNKH